MGSGAVGARECCLAGEAGWIEREESAGADRSHTGLLQECRGEGEDKGSIIPTVAGEAETITIGTPGQVARISFSAKSGETITLKTRESTIANGWVSVWNPEGTEVTGSSASFAGSGSTFEFSPSTSGTYTVLLEPQAADTGSVKLTAYLGSHPNVLRRPAADVGATASSPAGPSTRPRLGSFERVFTQPLASSARNIAPKQASRTTRAATAASTSPVVSVPSDVRKGPPADRRSGASEVNASSNASVAQRGLSSITPEMRAFRPTEATTGRIEQAWEAGPQPSPWTKVPQLQGFYGTTSLSGQVLAQDGLPLAGVRVALEGTYLAVKTDKAGRFLLSGRVPSGHQVLVVGGDTVTGHQRYGSYEVGVEIADHSDGVPVM